MNYNFKTYFLMLALYNQWANTKLFAILGTLTEEQLNQDCHAYFKSLIQTANHVLVGDILWFERIRGLASSNLALDTILYPDIVPLTQARVEQDQRFLSFVENCDETISEISISYLRRGQFYTEPLVEILAHLFNHQTHHRGQMHNMVFQLTGESLELDLIYFQRAHAHLYRS